MMKRTLQTLGWMLLAAPVLVVGCGDSSNNNGGTGGSAPIKWDGGGGAGGSPDGAAGPEVQVPPVDTGAAPDAPLGPDSPVLLDGAVADVAADAPIVDTRPPAVDGPAVDVQAIDTTPAVDVTVPEVCKETTKWSGGTVTVDRTLTKACSPYTIKTDIDVYSNTTLTIEAGVTIRFNPGTNISIGYNSNGKLLAVGTAAEPIVFTSSATSPGAGDWAGVQLWTNTMNGTTLQYVKFDYCGSNDDACVLGTGAKAGRVTVDHVTFAHVGLKANAIWEKDRDSNFTISGCTFSDIPTGQYAISVYAPSFAGIDSTNAFNGNAMVELMGGTIAADASWKNVGTAVAVTDDINIEGTATPVLTVAAGSVFKFAADTVVSIGYGGPGSLTVAGTATALVKLTSLAGTPAAGDWKGIQLWNKGTAKILYATLSYAGSDKGAINLVSNTTSLDIESSTIDNSATYGVYIPCNSTAKFVHTNDTFTSCADGDFGPGPAGTDCH